MKKTILIIALFACYFGIAQFNPIAPWMPNPNGRNQDLTINDIRQSFDNYWKGDFEEDIEEGTGYEPFKRWEYHWINNTTDEGYLISPQEMWNAFNQKKSRSLNRAASVLVPTSNWVPIGPINNSNVNSTRARGRVTIAYVDPSNPNTVYMGTPAGGIWKSTNSGSTWSPMSDELPQIGVSGIAVDYSNSNTIYIATGDKDATDTYSIGVLKSTDGGITWNTTGLTFTNTSTTAGDIVIHPTNNQILWCATSAGLYKTTNAGTTWTIVQAGNFAQGSIRLKPGDPTTVYAVTRNKFYKSTDTGATFVVNNVASGLPTTAGRFIMDVTAANANYIYVLASTTANGFQGIYRSVNGGTSWTKTSGTTNILESTQSWYDLALAVSPTNASELYTGCLNVWKSTDGGATSNVINSWSNYSPSFTHADIHYLGFFNNNLYCGSDGGLYVSNNGGTTFSEKTGEAQIGQIYKISVSKQTASKISAGFQDNGGYAYNSGLWRDYHGGDGMDTAISPVNNNTIYGFLYYGQSLFISSNSGTSLSSSVAGPTGETGNWVTPMIANSVGELFSGFTKLFKLNGSAWAQQSGGNVGSGNIDLLAVDPSNDDIMYMANGTGLYKSINRGITVSLVYTAASAITSIDVHSSDSSIVYLTTQGTSGQALKSTNGGLAFTSINQGLPNIGKNIIVHQGRNSNNPLYVGTSLGVYYRDDTMSQFEPFDINLPNVSVTDLEINVEDGLLIASTYGRGVWQTAIPVEVPNSDVKFVNVISPVNAAISCTGTVIPQVVVKNNGSTNINTVTLNYTINTTPYTSTWNGVIAPSQNATIDLPQLNLVKGTYTISVNSTIPSDAYPDNNSGVGIFYIDDSGTVNQTNTFENVSDALVSYNDGDNSSQWQRGLRTGSALDSGLNKVYTTNFTDNYPDTTKSFLVSQCYNLTQIANPQISFKMAFDLEQNWDIVYVEYSTNLGSTWNVLGQLGAGWYNSDRTPNTTGNDCNNCVGAQWTGTDTTLQTYSYSLNTLSSQSNIIFRIVFQSDESVNQLGVVVDDFLISGTLSNTTNQINTISIYPNPTKGLVNIVSNNYEIKNISIFDISGKEIVTNDDVNSNNFTINMSNLSSGIYFVKITSSTDEQIVKRIIKN